MGETLVFERTKRVFGRIKRMFGRSKRIFKRSKLVFRRSKRLFGRTKRMFIRSKLVFERIKRIFRRTKRMFGRLKMDLRGATLILQASKPNSSIPYSLFLVSMVIVTGPSFSKLIFMSAPKMPHCTSLPINKPNCFFISS